MTDLAPLDIVLAGVRVGECNDPRRCVVIGVRPPAEYLILPCSAQLDLYREGADFLISSDHPDFPATGLKKTSYVMDVEAQLIEEERIQKRYGHLRGLLAAAFEEWLER